MTQYFDHFPLAQYNGQLCRQITARTALSQNAIKSTSLFYPYVAVDGERADVLSFLYYSNPQLDWLVYFANDIIDPYYGWHLSTEQFHTYIADKYGSVYNAQMKIKHFQVDWASDDRVLTISAYNALPALAPTNTKQYWQPVHNEAGIVIHYVRKQLDTTTTTNMVLSLELSSTVGFVVGELISQQTNNVVTGYAEITLVNDTHIIVQHVVGSFNTTTPITGFDSGITGTPSLVTTLKENIPSAELPYWKPISWYDYEELQNQQRKTLRVVSNKYAEVAESQLKATLS